jgi:hypothetical protein
MLLLESNVTHDTLCRINCISIVILPGANTQSEAGAHASLSEVTAMKGELADSDAAAGGGQPPKMRRPSLWAATKGTESRHTRKFLLPRVRPSDHRGKSTSKRFPLCRLAHLHSQGPFASVGPLSHGRGCVHDGTPVSHEAGISRLAREEFTLSLYLASTLSWEHGWEG